jgi:hypothetical protein
VRNEDDDGNNSGGGGDGKIEPHEKNYGFFFFLLC